MADVASAFRSWSATAASNSPSGATVVGAGLDDNLRQIQATVRQYLASPATPMASAATVDLSTADGSYISITGTTAITAFGTESAGIQYLLKFAGALTLTHNGTSLILPGGANITTAAGDLALMISEGSGNWRCAHYQKADGTAVVSSSVSAATQADQEAASSTAVYVSPGRQHFHPGSAKAWAYWNGTSASPITPLASYGVSSITKSSTGVYVVNLSTSMSSANYLVLPHAADSAGPQAANICHVASLATGGPTIKTYNVSNAATDYDTMMVVIYGDV